MNGDALDGLRAEMRHGFAEFAATQEAMRREFAQFAVTQEEMRREFAELASTQEEMRRGLAATQEEMRRGFAEFAATQEEMRRDLEQVRHDLASTQAEMRSGFTEMRSRFDRVETQGRRQGVLLEATRADVRGIAEGHTVLVAQLERYREENTTAHAETRALVRTAYRDLDRRVSRLEGRPDGQSSPP